MSSFTAIILTYNEQLHIERCVTSARQIADRIIVVDSFSTDRTVKLAEGLGCEVRQHAFTTQAAQLRWALDSIPIASEWIMRIDADEVVSPPLAGQINAAVAAADAEVTGFLVPRTVKFQGKLITHGGFPQWQLKIWRPGCAEVEQRWMDEHMVLTRGTARALHGDYVDDNLNGITWWTAKHNGYASREAIGLLNAKYRFASVPEVPRGLPWQAKYKRWIKDHVYWRLPPGLRAGLFFAYRMIPQRGILDGADGFPFHFLQAYWYRYLVDLKVREVEECMRREQVDCVTAIRRTLDVDPLR